MSILGKTCKDFSKDFSEGADKLADICVEKNDKSAKKTGKELSKETYYLFKRLALNARDNLKKIQLKKIIYDMSFQMGKRSRLTRIKIVNFLKS